jgi:hypothetical protein
LVQDMNGACLTAPTPTASPMRTRLQTAPRRRGSGLDAPIWLLDARNGNRVTAASRIGTRRSSVQPLVGDKIIRVGLDLDAARARRLNLERFRWSSSSMSDSDGLCSRLVQDVNSGLAAAPKRDAAFMFAARGRRAANRQISIFGGVGRRRPLHMAPTKREHAKRADSDPLRSRPVQKLTQVRGRPDARPR